MKKIRTVWTLYPALLQNVELNEYRLIGKLRIDIPKYFPKKAE